MEWEEWGGADRNYWMGAGKSQLVNYVSNSCGDILCHYTFSPFIFLTMYYCFFWISSKFTSFNLRDISCKCRSIIMTTGLGNGREYLPSSESNQISFQLPLSKTPNSPQTLFSNHSQLNFSLEVCERGTTI